MPVTATLRVVPSPVGSVEPRPEQIREAVRRLGMLGFRVVNAGHYSVIVQSDARRFEDVLGVRAPGRNKGLATDFRPRDSSLVGIVDRVEIAPPAQFLDM